MGLVGILEESNLRIKPIKLAHNLLILLLLLAKLPLEFDNVLFLLLQHLLIFWD